MSPPHLDAVFRGGIRGTAAVPPDPQLLLWRQLHQRFPGAIAHLTATFQQLETLVRGLLETVISHRYAAIPLQNTRPSFHLGALDNDRLAEGYDFYLAVSGDRPAAEIVEAVPLKFKVGSPDDVEKILNSGLPGVGLHHVAQTPPAVPVRIGNHYFALEPGGALFERMIKSRSICIYVPQAMPPLTLGLIAVLR